MLLVLLRAWHAHFEGFLHLTHPGCRLKAERGNTDDSEWQKTFNVKKNRFTGGSEFLTQAIDPGAGMIRNSFPNLPVLLAFLLDMMRIVIISPRSRRRL
jgi:hypothetical protein